MDGRIIENYKRLGWGCGGCKKWWKRHFGKKRRARRRIEEYRAKNDQTE